VNNSYTKKVNKNFFLLSKWQEMNIVR
jgi:hypothetical protein